MKVSLMVGSIDEVGYKLGVVEGICEGSKVGISDGNIVGLGVGDIEGIYDGVSEGCFVGDEVGLVVGTVGDEDTVGDEEGLAEKTRLSFQLFLRIFNASLEKAGGSLRVKSYWSLSCNWRSVDLDMDDANTYFELPLIRRRRRRGDDDRLLCGFLMLVPSVRRRWRSESSAILFWVWK